MSTWTAKQDHLGSFDLSDCLTSTATEQSQIIQIGDSKDTIHACRLAEIENLGASAIKILHNGSSCERLNTNHFFTCLFLILY